VLVKQLLISCFPTSVIDLCVTPSTAFAGETGACSLVLQRTDRSPPPCSALLLSGDVKVEGHLEPVSKVCSERFSGWPRQRVKMSKVDHKMGPSGRKGASAVRLGGVARLREVFPVSHQAEWNPRKPSGRVEWEGPVTSSSPVPPGINTIWERG